MGEGEALVKATGPQGNAGAFNPAPDLETIICY